MSFGENLRNLVSVQGIPQNSSQATLQSTLLQALKQTPPPQPDAVQAAQQQAAGAVSAAGNRQNVFVTSASLATFPVASGVITVIWKLLQVLGPTLVFMKSPFIPLILALLLGAFLAYMDLTDPERAEAPTTREKVVKSGIALINALFLTAAVLGIDTAVLQ